MKKGKDLNKRLRELRIVNRIYKVVLPKCDGKNIYYYGTKF